MLIGITGGIGSGKSTIAKQLRQMGYEVYDTDSQAKRLIVEDAHIREQITELFGPEAYQDGIYQTAFIAQQVFADKTLLARLNEIVHPAVRQDILKKFRSTFELLNSSSAASEPSELFFIECAILYTAHLDELCDKVVVVTAPEEVRLTRTIARDNSNVDRVRARMSAQNVEADLRRADIIINNDGTTPIPTLCKQILMHIKACK
jgi:dephospho-CoA kinase